MIYLTISLIIVGIIISLSYGINRHKRKGKETTVERQYQYFVTFVLSLLAVFTGAFLAFQLSDIQTRQQEKSYLSDLISRTNIELEDESITITMLYDYFNQKSPEEAERRMNGNPVSDTFSLNILLNSQEFSKYISPLDAMMIQNFTRQKEKVRGFMNNTSYPLKDRIEAFSIYSKMLKDVKLMLSLELDYMNKKISYEELLDKLSAQANFINNDELKGFFDNQLYGSSVPVPPITAR